MGGGLVRRGLPSVRPALLFAIGCSHALEQVDQHGYPARGGLGLCFNGRLGSRPALLEAVTSFLANVTAVGIEPNPGKTVVKVSAAHAEQLSFTTKATTRDSKLFHPATVPAAHDKAKTVM